MLFHAMRGESVYGGGDRTLLGWSPGGGVNSSGFQRLHYSWSERVTQGVTGLSAMVGGSVGLAGLTGRAIGSGWMLLDAGANVALGAHATYQGDRIFGPVQMALGALGAVPAWRATRRWIRIGQQDDHLIEALSSSERALYEEGQRSVSPWFWNANDLGDFTKSIARPTVTSPNDVIRLRSGFLVGTTEATGAARAAGVIARGRFLAVARPVSLWSLPTLYWDLGTAMLGPGTHNLGPTPELRKFLLSLHVFGGE
jgi:hypothetical protein